MSWSSFEHRPYVPVAQRQRNAARELAQLAKKGGFIPKPIKVEGRTISQSFWGQAWCENLESYMDYANRLPRGRSYLRNGSVVHLDVKPGKIEARVCGSELYNIRIQIVPVSAAKWKSLCQACAGGIGSLVELLQGRLSGHVMNIITHKTNGLFPSPAEIRLNCSCPDSASLCKHLAAVLYGVGARLDQNPDLLFALRSVNHEELIAQATETSSLTTSAAAIGTEMSDSEMGAVFGIELDTQTVASPQSPTPALAKPARPSVPHPSRKEAAKKSSRKKTAASRRLKLQAKTRVAGKK